MLNKVLQKLGMGKKADSPSAMSQAERLMAGVTAKCIVIGLGDSYSGKTNVLYVDNRLNIENSKHPGKFHRSSEVTEIKQDGAGGYLFRTAQSFYQVKPL